MRIHFFDRKIVRTRISIEKVFDVVKGELKSTHHSITSFENPFELSSMIRSLFYFRRNQGDISHITGDIHWACLLLNSRITVLTIHDIVGIKNYKSSLKRRFYLVLWLYLPLRKLQYVTVISEKTKQEILQFYPWAASKIRVIHNPLTNAIFIREPVIKPAHEMRILVVGTRANKNLDRVIEATKDLDCRIQIVGSVNDAQKQLVKESSATVNTVDFVTDNELLSLYQESDILCFPSLYEGFGMPVIEAQSCGCVVITSDIEPMKTIAGDAALFVNPYDVDDIRDKLWLLIDDFDLRRQLIIKGYKNAENFLPEKIADQYLNLYSEILQANFQSK